MSQGEESPMKGDISGGRKVRTLRRKSLSGKMGRDSDLSWFYRIEVVKAPLNESTDHSSGET